MTRPPLWCGRPARTESPSVQAGRLHHKHAARPGATLAELLVVVLILAVAAGIAVQSLESWGGTRAEAAGRALAGDLRYARDRAVRTGRVHTIVVDAAANRYLVTEPGGDVPDPTAPGRPGPFVRDLGALIGGGVRVEDPRAIPAGEAVTELRFDPTGAASWADDSGVPGGAGTAVAFWVREPVGTAWQVIRARVVRTTGGVWTDGPHPYDATLQDRLMTGEPEIGAPG